ncbi:MAG: NAD(P)/FAD-dependent oxidoreductase [Chlorobium sp.]|jgi:C-3',4' desaturase CrtD|uniref:phytoene desaturase family protein n=1 Tax=Chlorobium sp. TaxID=1095 RepID=UPI001DC15A9D|nr:NAD(P)/FAD-dependent oxidoreductase [Chlorobium sp.]MBN1278734.1 FAD-dependent oxidoreductase [Chlorobiaceae bacterium]MCF8216156.1 NAD(P)/FAD-dependent oxidoreductase [Chlorobium sp.]MCF8271019.1 NAD(P)/FAD-dependent oxidoreductase [Chlorobium sp.]MCF8287432.1 NAD(P)/FAD-dependent oxidoreductase [Chlorobium sp.]MCF8290932.1 NAD(P)/FAD-dependent oxidoreductase [Chlorobium sp.]
MGISETNIVVIGAGIGGLAAGALLASEGASVTVLEAQLHAGGCAATFSRKGYRFEAGATVGCGFHAGGPMQELGRELGIVWPVEALPVAWQYRHDALCLDLVRSKADLLKRFPHSRDFWNEQEELSRLLWKLASGGLSWPPASLGDLGKLLRKGVSGLPGTARLLRFATKTAYDWLAAHRLDADQEFVRFIDAQLLISVQTTSRHASAVNAAIALDLPSSGAWRVHGGIGSIAELLAANIERNGGAVLYRKQVVRIDSIRRQIIGVETADGNAYAADMVLADLTPASLSLLVDSFDAATILRSKGPLPEWSAFMLYLGMDAGAVSSTGAGHLQITGSSGNLGEGNSIFVSCSSPHETDRAPEGLLAVTVSTHTRPQPWFAALEQSGDEYTQRKKAYAERVLDLMATQLPGVREAIRFIESATPVTWQRFTGRHRGFVGGYPQTSLFDVRDPSTGFDNMFLVGDSVFPGQSLPGVVTGARRAVELVRRVKRGNA